MPLGGGISLGPEKKRRMQLSEIGRRCIRALSQRRERKEVVMS